MPSFDAGWDFVAQLNISWPFQLPNPFSLSPLATLSLFTNSCLPSFSPCYWCQRRISLTDSLQQMVLQGPVAFYRPDSTIYALLMHEWSAALAIHDDFVLPNNLHEQVRWGFANKGFVVLQSLPEQFLILFACREVPFICFIWNLTLQLSVLLVAKFLPNQTRS